MRYYRQAGELEGKELSAQTIAALMASQGADDPSALRSGRPMPARLLEFLLRHRAIRYWRRNRWLKSDPFNDQLTLTPEGLDKIRGRLNGNGEAGGQSVSTSDVIEQFQILTGRLTAQGLDSFVWPPGAEGPPAREGSAQEGNPRPDESAGQVEIAAPADAKLTSLQRKILAYLATHDGWATRQDMYGFTGYERGYSKALGAATKGPAKAGTLAGR